MQAAPPPREEAKRKPLPALRTLVLNADGRPLSTYPLRIVSAQDAVSAIWCERTIVVENWPDAFFRSPSTTIAVPKVMILREFVPVSGEPKFCRRSILLRDKFCCLYCGEKFASPDLTYDHVIPKSRGGKTTWENIATACLGCNARKANSLPNFSGRKGEGQMRLLKEPRRPTAPELLRAGLEFLPNDIRDDFGSWLYWNAELQA
jgi:5-methylcytosine-specific restriction endonuclease McrA